MNDENRQGRAGDDRGRGPRKPGSGRPGGAGSGRPSSGRPGAGKPSGDRKPYSRDGKPSGDRKPYSRDGKPGDRPARPARDAERKPWAKDGERKPYSRDGKPAGEPKPWEKRDGDRPARPARDGERKPWAKDGERKPFSRDGKPAGERKPWEKRDGERPARDGDRKPFSRDGKPGRPERGGSDRPKRDYDLNPLTPFELKRREERANEPELEAQFTGTNLDRAVIRDISTLNEDNKLVVGKHLESAAFFADSDPERALQHALAAKRRASRLAVVRETVGIMAYVTEDFALALAELRTAARISGSNDQIALIIDCLRALDRSEDGLKIARDLDRAALPREARIDLAIVLSGIRLDRGETDRAFAELQIAELDPTNATLESVGLFDANAEVLDELGRTDEAAKWRRYARATEAHFEPDEEMTIRTEYLEPEVDVDAFDVTEDDGTDVEAEATEPEDKAAE
ncbi:MAG: hypothetical protein RLZZ40_169 [Actinomycetota bacterium]